MKRGFTLTELLGSIVVMGVIAVIIVPNIYSKIMQSKESALQSQTTVIEKAASDYLLEHKDLLDIYKLNATLISIESLKSEKYLKNEKIKNPVTGDDMNGCVVVTYDDNTSGYNYKYDEKSCTELETDYPKIVSAYQTIVDNVSTTITGDGLYEIDNEYVYRGKNPNNYLKIGQDLYRIISLDKDNKTLKAIKVNGELKNYEESTQTTEYSFRVSTLNTYLNSSVYNTYTDAIKKHLLANATWLVGNVTGEKMNLIGLKSVVSTGTYNASIGLLNIYEYAKASTTEECSDNYLSDSCRNNNYLNFKDKYWLINNKDNAIWYVDPSSGLKAEENVKDALYNVHPVLNLTANTEMTGTGTEEDPYTLKEGV